MPACRLLQSEPLHRCIAELLRGWPQSLSGRSRDTHVNYSHFTMCTVSVVIPVFNEKENLPLLLARLAPILEHAAPGAFEILFVDDGSVDGSTHLLDGLRDREPRIKVIHFSRNFGHQAALQAGLEHASGDCVVLMDADLQDPPELIPSLLSSWRQGFEVVYAVRRRRKEGLLKRVAYASFYRTLRAIAEIDVPLDSGDFCLLDRRVAEVLLAMPERGRFLRGLRSWVGFRQIGVEYDREARHAGTPKYSLSKLIALAVSGYVGFSAVPLRLASWLGFITAFTGFALAVWVAIAKLAGIATPWGWASTIAVMLFIGGIQMLILGIVGEYLGRMYDEVRKRPLYVIRERVGFGRESSGRTSENADFLKAADAARIR
jgi:polyisoprenyl-phosphate glycosyltransferase